MKLLQTTALLFVFIATSCCTSGKTTKTDTQANAQQMEKMMNEGFTMGTIVASNAEGDCPYIISSEIEGTTVMYDPINLEEGYKKDGMKLWYKYRPLRMANRCDKANPISLESTQIM